MSLYRFGLTSCFMAAAWLMALDTASVAQSAVLWPLMRAVAGMMDPSSIVRHSG